MPNRRRKFVRCPSHCLDRKGNTPRIPANLPQIPVNPASSVTLSPWSLWPKRRITPLGLKIELKSNRIRHLPSECLLVKERVKKHRLTKLIDQQVLVWPWDKKTIGGLCNLLAGMRKYGRRSARGVINSGVNILKLESNSKVSSFNFNQERSCYLFWNTYILSFSSTFKANTQVLESSTIHTSSVKELNEKQDALI